MKACDVRSQVQDQDRGADAEPRQHMQQRDALATARPAADPEHGELDRPLTGRTLLVLPSPERVKHLVDHRGSRCEVPRPELGWTRPLTDQHFARYDLSWRLVGELPQIELRWGAGRGSRSQTVKVVPERERDAMDAAGLRDLRDHQTEPLVQQIERAVCAQVCQCAKQVQIGRLVDLCLDPAAELAHRRVVRRDAAGAPGRDRTTDLAELRLCRDDPVAQRRCEIRRLVESEAIDEPQLLQRRPHGA